MSLGETLKNPLVWGGGAALGLILLLRSSPANAEASSALDAVNPTAMSTSVAMNAAVMGANIDIARINAELGKVAYQADLAKQLGFYSLIKAMDDNNAMVQNQRTISQAGITNTLIQSSTAIIVDHANNAARLGMAYQETMRAQIAADAQVQTAFYQYKASKAVSKNNMIGQIAGAVGGVISTALPLAFGVPPIGAMGGGGAGAVSNVLPAVTGQITYA